MSGHYFPRHPAGVLVRQSRRLLRMIRVGDNLAVRAQLLSMDRSALLLPAMRSWLLLLSELGAARLPGGVLAEPDNAGGLIRREVGPDESPWQLDVRESLTLAVGRDGGRLFPVIARAVSGPDVIGYVSGVATATALVVDSLHLSGEVIAAGHLLGYFTSQAGHWSVAGFGLRQIVMTLAVMDTGQQFADAMLGPEIEALGNLSGHDQARLLGVLGGAFGAVLDSGDDFVEVERHPDSGPAGADEPWQEQAAQIAMTVGRTFHTATGASEIKKLGDSLTPTEIALGCYGLGNMLAVRCRELWGPPGG